MLPEFLANRHMKVVSLSALRTGRLPPPPPTPNQEIFLVLISVTRLSQPQGRSAVGSIMSMKNSNDTIGNRTRDLPTCSAVPQPTAPPDVYSCPIATKLEFSRHIFEKKHSNIKLHENPSSGSRVVPCGQAET